MTVFELAACIDGYNRAHGGEDTDPLTPDEYDDMIERHRAIVEGK